MNRLVGVVPRGSCCDPECCAARYDEDVLTAASNTHTHSLRIVSVFVVNLGNYIVALHRLGIVHEPGEKSLFDPS